MSNNTDYIEIQKAYEMRYSRKQLHKLLRDLFSPILNKWSTDLLRLERKVEKDLDCKEYSDKQLQHILEYDSFKTKYFKMLDILSILGERGDITVSAIVSMLCERDIETNGEYLLNLLIEGAELGFYDIRKSQDGEKVKVFTKYTITPEYQAIINRFKYLNPMLVQPVDVNIRNNNKGSGHLTIYDDSLILGGVYHNKDIDSKFLDNINNIAYELNIDVIQNFRNAWKHLDKPKPNETRNDFIKRVKAFNKYEQGCYTAFAELYENGNKFWFTHKYDKRGRAYCSGYYCNYQGNPFAKAVIEFKNKKKISRDISFFA